MTGSISNKSFIRVANITEEGKLGGPQVRIAQVANSLHGQVETIVVMPDENSGTYRKLCEELGIRYKTFWMSRVTKEWSVALRYFLFFSYEVIRLFSYFKRENFDLVHVSGGSWHYKGVIAGRLAKRKVIWHLNDTSMPWVFREIFRLLSPLANGYVYASKRSMKYYSSLIKQGKPEFLIPAPVDTLKFNPTQKYNGDGAFKKGRHGKIVIGTVANVNPIKGLEVFIHCAAELNKINDNIVFVVVGKIYSAQQRYFKQLQQLCEYLSVDNIEFVGGRSDVRPMLQNFDVYVCSSQAESSPMSVWEAMAMEKPVVSTDVGDVPIYVRDGYNGFIVDVGDSKRMAERIAALAVDENMRHDFGCRARAIAVQELDIEKCAQRHLDAYVNIVGTRKKSPELINNT